MGVRLEEMLGRLPAERRARVKARTDELIAEEMTLRALRHAMGKTQVTVAKALHVEQASISRLEKRADMLISTLDRYLRAIGGRLRLVVEVKGRPAVTLSGFGEIDPGAGVLAERRGRAGAGKSAARKREHTTGSV